MNWRALIASMLLCTVSSAQAALPGVDHEVAEVDTRVTTPVPAFGVVPQLRLDYTAPPLLPIPVGEDNIVPLVQGEKAPFTGQLFDLATSLRWAHYLQQAKLRLTEDVLAERKTCSAYLGYMGRVVELEKEYGAAVERDLRARVLTQEQRSVDLQSSIDRPGFFNSKGTWYGLGVVTTLLIGGLVGVLAYEIK